MNLKPIEIQSSKEDWNRKFKALMAPKEKKIASRLNHETLSKSSPRLISRQ